MIKDIVEWTYPRNEGDLVVYAKNAEEVAETLKNHGFINIDVKKIRRSGPTLEELLELQKK